MSNDKPPTRDEQIHALNLAIKTWRGHAEAHARERDALRLELEGVKALAIEAEKAHAAEVAAIKAERDEARNAVQVACDVAVTAACAAIEVERDEAYAQRDAARAELAKVKAELDVFATVDEQRRAAIERFVEERDEARATAAQHEKALKTAFRAWDKFGGPHAAAEHCGDGIGTPCVCGLSDLENFITDRLAGKDGTTMRRCRR